jgi:hypothetical protein
MVVRTAEEIEEQKEEMESKIRTKKDFSIFLYSSSLVILGQFLWQLRHFKIVSS